MPHNRSHSRSVLGDMIHSHLEKKRKPKREAKAKKDRLTEKMKDYDEYEKELKKRKNKKRKFSDREIDPKKIKADREEYKKLYGNMLGD